MAEENENIKELPIGTYNISNNTKWIFNIPLAQLFNVKYGNVKNGNLLDYPLNCKNVTFPEFKMGSTTVSFLNYSFEVSTRSNNSSKELTITFLVSENWLQYLMLLKWFELEDFTRYDANRSDTVLIDMRRSHKHYSYF